MTKYQITLDIDVPDGAVPGPEHLYAALEEALDQASGDPAELLLRVTTAEPASDWVIGSETDAGLVLTDKGTWSACTVDSVPQHARHEADSGHRIPLVKGQVWCRRDLIEGRAVIADLHSDDRIIDIVVDIRPFLETASVEDINTLISEDWAYAESADRIAYTLERAGDPGANRLFWYLGLNPCGVGDEPIGFGLRADGDAALSWLSHYRPDIHASLDLDEVDDMSDALDVL